MCPTMCTNCAQGACVHVCECVCVSVSHGEKVTFSHCHHKQISVVSIKVAREDKELNNDLNPDVCVCVSVSAI